jgi:hypothetical protein
MLVDHKRREVNRMAGTSVTVAGDDLVFRTPGGGWVTPERFTHVMEDLIEQSHVPRITPNGLPKAAQLGGHFPE